MKYLFKQNFTTFYIITISAAIGNAIVITVEFIIPHGNLFPMDISLILFSIFIVFSFIIFLKLM